MRPGPWRNLVVWGAVVAGAVAPTVGFLVSLRGAESGRPLRGGWSRAVDMLVMPGVFPGMMFKSVVVQMVTAGLFWGVVAGALAVALVAPWRDRGAWMRALTWCGLAALLYGVLVAQMAAGWNPD